MPSKCEICSRVITPENKGKNEEYCCNCEQLMKGEKDVKSSNNIRNKSS